MQKPIAEVFTWPSEEPQPRQGTLVELPIGASGLRQVHELVHQLRGSAGDRQVAGEPRVGYAQVYGAPGTAAVTILSR